MSASIAIIAPSSVPFQIGGAEKFWWGLRDGLARYSGSLVELIKIPAPEENFQQIISSYRTFAELDLSHFDMVISTKYPAWMVKHKNHVLYLQHPLRGLYDTYHFTALPEQLGHIPGPLRELVSLIRKPEPNRTDLAKAFELCNKALSIKSLPWDIFSFPGPLIRESVHFFDKVGQSGIKTFLAISNTVRLRPDYFPVNADVRVLPHPSDITQYFEAPGEYIFTASRLNPMKRLHLIVEAMQYVEADIPLKIAGTGIELDNLKSLAANDSRIEFLGHVPDAALPELYSKAIFVPFVPYDEDYGLITIEAMHSAKPVLTTSDSGGVAEFVKNGLTGLCVPPDAKSLGHAMQQMLDNPEQTLQMGLEARKQVAQINWKDNVQSLIAHTATSSNSKGRHQIVVLSHFSPKPFGSGGERRLYHLCAELARNFAVCLISMGNQTQTALDVLEHSEYFRELRLPWPLAAVEEAENLVASTGQSLDDLALMLHCKEDSLHHEILGKQIKDASCIIVSHPYIFPTLQEFSNDIPIIYDAHNVEADLKGAILGKNLPDLAQKTTDIERQCLERANGLIVCSEDDKKRFQDLYKTVLRNSCVAPNGFDSTRLIFTSADKRQEMRRKLAYPDAKLAIFTGSGHAPNVAAVKGLIQIARSSPEVEFLIVGSVCTQEATKALERPDNVHLLGIVSEDVKDALLQVADVALNPVTYGSGTNLKIVEYIAAGIPCVSTPFGVRGLDEDLLNAIQIGPIEEFSGLILRALDRDEKLLRAAAAKVTERYSWQMVFRPMHGLLDVFCGGKNNEVAD